MTWQPPLAEPRIEQDMERKDVPESDRDEVRRFSEFLGRKKAMKDGQSLPPAPMEMRDWLLGVDGMKSEHQQRVEQFMRAAGQTVNDEPTMPSEDDRRRMAALIMEEAMELVNALGFEVWAFCQGLIERDDWFLETADIGPNLPEMVDGVVDCHWVTTAVLAGAGIPDKPFLDEVYRSNMSKFIDGHRREDGKWVKGPSYSPADIAGILAKLQAKEPA